MSVALEIKSTPWYMPLNHRSCHHWANGKNKKLAVVAKASSSNIRLSQSPRKPSFPPVPHTDDALFAIVVSVMTSRVS
jgi:hypothetical protein